MNCHENAVTKRQGKGFAIAKALSRLVAIGLCAMLGVTGAARAQEVLILTGTDPSYLPVIVAVEKGLFKKQGVNVTQRIFPSGADAMLAFKTLRASFVASAVLPSVILWNDGDAVGVGRLFAAPDYQAAVVSSSIKSPADLQGKKIATRLGSSAEFFLYSYLKKHSIDAKQLKILDLSPNETLSAFVSGQIDGFFLWVPYPALAQKAMSDKARILATSRGYFTENIYLTANKAFAESNPETVSKVIRALQESIQYTKSNPEDAAAIVARKLRTEPSVVMNTIQINPFVVGYDEDSARLVDEISQFLHARGKLKTMPRPEKEMFDRRYLRSVDPALAGGS